MKIGEDKIFQLISSAGVFEQISPTNGCSRLLTVAADPCVKVRNIMKTLISLIVVLLTFPGSVNAEIEKVAVPCEQKLCFYWWPKLVAVKGWHHDREHSYLYTVNAQAPDGYSFANAVSVIYAKALYKPRIPKTTSLEMLIKDDKEQFVSRDPTIAVSEVEALVTGDGQILKSFTFFPKEKGNWEQVSYGEEDDFYLIFTVSSRTKEGFTKTLDAYKQFIIRYTEKP